MLAKLLVTLRPRQWVKNLFVAAPLFFALRLGDLSSVLHMLAAVALFCLISGCVYVINDLVDIEADREHPKKRFRPLAAGELSPRVARTFLIAAVPLAVTLGLLLAPTFAACLVAYFVLNLGYSFWFKKTAYLDVLLIAVFFILRVLGGGSALADVDISPWLVVCTFLLALFLGFGKRAHELALSSNAVAQRAALARYDLAKLTWILHVLAALVVLVYVAYTQSPATIAHFGTTALVYTVPFSVFAILRFIHLATTHRDSESPTEQMLRDPWFVVNFGLYLAVATGILYAV